MAIRPHTETGTIYNNLWHQFGNDIVELLKANPDTLVARHAAWEFNGSVWFDGQQWHEEVWRYQIMVGSYNNADLSALIEEVNNEFGYG